MRQRSARRLRQPSARLVARARENSNSARDATLNFGFNRMRLKVAAVVGWLNRKWRGDTCPVDEFNNKLQ